jgi:hypothetical protein
MNSNRQSTPPLRILLCNCLKCDNKWNVKPELVPSPEGQESKNKRYGKPTPQMVWIFPPEHFEQCKGCGTKNPKGSNSIRTKLVKVDDQGRVCLKSIRKLD